MNESKWVVPDQTYPRRLAFGLIIWRSYSKTTTVDAGEQSWAVECQKTVSTQIWLSYWPFENCTFNGINKQSISTVRNTENIEITGKKIENINRRRCNILLNIKITMLCYVISMFLNWLMYYTVGLNIVYTLCNPMICQWSKLVVTIYFSRLPEYYRQNSSCKY